MRIILFLFRWFNGIVNYRNIKNAGVSGPHIRRDVPYLKFSHLVVEELWDFCKQYALRRAVLSTVYRGIRETDMRSIDVTTFVKTWSPKIKQFFRIETLIRNTALPK